MKRPKTLSLFIIMLAINAIVAGIHYLLIYLNLIPIKGKIATVTEFAIADIIVTILPSLIGAYGLWRLKKWGWMLTVIACGGYLHGMIVLQVEASLALQFGSMSFIAVYFLFFSISLLTYLWRQRGLFI